MPNQNEVKSAIESWLDLFKKYSRSIFGEPHQNELDELRTKLQQTEPYVTKYLVEIIGDGQIEVGSFGIRHRSTIHDLLGTVVLGGNNEKSINFADYVNVIPALLNRAIGKINSGLWPPIDSPPILKIKDSVLRTRCSDLLASPGRFDRAVREATLVLEDRLLDSISHEKLSELIPNSSDQSGEYLVNKILSPIHSNAHN